MTAGSRTATVTPVGDRQIRIVRELDAPRHLVYRALTEPELVRRWWHANHGEMTVCEMDVRVGGRWRYAMGVPGQGEVAFHGEYREIVPDERIVFTEAFEGIPDPDANAALTTATLTETDGRTTLELLVEHRDPEGRDMHIASGMEDGVQQALELLEQAARSLR